MTAEIAILNKAAVALAADSAVTISAGSREEKIFDTADKLFELSDRNPIGVMIYNGMSFMETPLPSLVRQFRRQCASFTGVEDAARDFLRFLHEFGKEAPLDVKYRAIASTVAPVFRTIYKRFTDDLSKLVVEKNTPAEQLHTILPNLLTNTIDHYLRFFQGRPDAQFVGGAGFSFSETDDALLKRIADDAMPSAASEQNRDTLVEIGKLALRKNHLSSGVTGVVVAGFGSGELFPTLVSYEIDGVVCDRLKYLQTNFVDIDRRGTKASVIPFAQKEMVERFLYGLDQDIQDTVRTFCKATVSNISKQILAQIEFDDEEDRRALEADAAQAEKAFTDGLEAGPFEETRSKSRAEIEDMVEFMPKPEMAKMAEALVNLTSIKRRVSRGVETVGGAIDVALISQSEGFVWVKRKHYFPAELNPRYFARVRDGVDRKPEKRNGQAQRTRRAGSPRRRAPSGDPGNTPAVDGNAESSQENAPRN